MAAAAKKPGICSLIVEALVFFCSSVPIMLVDFSCLLLVTLTIMYVSRTSSTAAFAGASLGSLCFNVAGNMIAAAPLAAMDTVAPQAFGAGDVTGVGLAAQRCLILAVIFLLPTMPLWLLAEEILLAFGQPADVSSYAATYMRLLVPGLLPYTAFQCARKFLYAQEHASRLPPLLASVVGLACHVGWLELWCHETSLGIAHGAPVALSCTYTTMAVFLVGYICLRMPRAAAAWPRGAHTWQLLWADWAAWRHFTVTALAALASLTEWLFWEFTAFRVGRMGAVPFAAYSVAYSLEPVLFMLPLGLSTALSNAIGNHLGAGRVRAAKQLAAAALVLGALVVGVYVSVFALVGAPIATLFSTDEAVLSETRDMWPSFCGFLSISGPFAMMLGLLRGLGLQRGFALCVLFILWPVGAGLELGLASSPREVWQCLIGTYVLLISCMALLSGCSSWQRLSEVAIANSKVTGDTSDARASQVAAQSVTSSGGAASGLAAADSAAIQVSAL